MSKPTPTDPLAFAVGDDAVRALVQRAARRSETAAETLTAALAALDTALPEEVERRVLRMMERRGVHRGDLVQTALNALEAVRPQVVAEKDEGEVSRDSCRCDGPDEPGVHHKRACHRWRAAA